MSRARKRVAVLLSGGVDSALALALLREAGHELTAFYLKIWLEEELAFLGDCPWEEDMAYATAVCRQLEVPLQVVPLQEEYRQAVVEYALAALRAGHTPSPDVLCNRAIKFGAFGDRLAADYEAVASGHYARLRRLEDGRCQLLRGVDPVKDQSYFLAYLRSEQLSRLCFPIGGLHKREVRAMASERQLAPSIRKDSQGICFLGKLTYRDFVRAHLGEQPGPIREAGTGAELGSHRGHWFHTIGQRQGLGLGNGPWYVVAKDVTANTVYVAHDPAAAAPRAVSLEDGNWIEPLPDNRSRDQPVLVRIRHGDAPRPATLASAPADGGAGALLRFDSPVPGVASGQFAVLYSASEPALCYGSAVMLRPCLVATDAPGAKVSATAVEPTSLVVALCSTHELPPSPSRRPRPCQAPARAGRTVATPRWS